MLEWFDRRTSSSLLIDTVIRLSTWLPGLQLNGAHSHSALNSSDIFSSLEPCCSTLLEFSKHKDGEQLILYLLFYDVLDFLNFFRENTLDYGRRGGLQNVDTSDTFHFACLVFVQPVSKYFVRFKQVCLVRFSQAPCTFLYNLPLRILLVLIKTVQPNY